MLRQQLFRVLIYTIVFLVVSSIVWTARLGSFSAFLWTIVNFQDKIAADFVINVYLARTIAIGCALLYCYLIIDYFKSDDPEKHKKGVFYHAGFLAVYSFCMFWATKDIVFDAVGKPVKCLALNTDNAKYEFCDCRYKTHPIFGTDVIPADKIIKRIIPNEETKFFSSDGKISLVWYYQYPDKSIELFNQGGVHPQLGLPLLPMNTETARLIKLYLQSDKGMIVGINERKKRDINAEKAEEARLEEIREKESKENLARMRIADEKARQERENLFLQEVEDDGTFTDKQFNTGFIFKVSDIDEDNRLIEGTVYRVHSVPHEIGLYDNDTHIFKKGGRTYTFGIHQIDSDYRATCFLRRSGK